MINIYQFERKIKEKIDTDRNLDNDNKWKAKYNGKKYSSELNRGKRRNDLKIQKEDTSLR